MASGVVPSSSLSALSAPGPGSARISDSRPPSSAPLGSASDAHLSIEAKSSLTDYLQEVLPGLISRAMNRSDRANLEALGMLDSQLDGSAQGLLPADSAALGRHPIRTGPVFPFGSQPAPGPGLLSQLRAGTSTSIDPRDLLDLKTQNDPDEAVVERVASGAAKLGGVEDRYAPMVLANARTAGSVVQWVYSQDWNRSRNLHECVALAAGLDALVRDRVSELSDGMEILARRLVGVQLSDANSNNWDLCKAVEWPYPCGNLLDQRFYAKVVKDASAIRILRERSKPKGSASGRSGARFSQSAGPPGFDRRNLSFQQSPAASRGYYPNYNKNFKNVSPGTGPTAAGAARQ
jgi:hypothetical protein